MFWRQKEGTRKLLDLKLGCRRFGNETEAWDLEPSRREGEGSRGEEDDLEREEEMVDSICEFSASKLLQSCSDCKN